MNHHNMFTFSILISAPHSSWGTDGFNNIEKTYGYDLHRTCDEICLDYTFDGACTTKSAATSALA